MYALIYKKNDNEFVIMDAYYKGRWECDLPSLQIYLQYLSLQHKHLDLLSDEEAELRFKLQCKHQGYDEELTESIFRFIVEENLPSLSNYDPLHLASRLDACSEGIITPPTPIIEVTPFCNYGCTWCYIPPRDIDRELFYTQEHLDTHVITPLLEKYGLLEWCLTGGEPSVSPDNTAQIAQLITRRTNEILGKDPVSIYLLTNGFHLKENIAAYKEAGINCYQVSLSSPVREHEIALRIPPRHIDSHKEAVEGLKAVVEAGLRAEINMIIQPNGAHAANNLEDIPQMFELAKSIGITMLRVIPAVPCGQAMENNIWMSKEEYNRVKLMVREGRATVPEIIVDCPIDQEIEADREIFCRAGTLWLYINFKGEIYACNNLQNADSLCWPRTIKEDSVDVIWEQSELLNYMRDYERGTLSAHCIGCDSRVECVGECRALAWARYKQYDLVDKPGVCFKDYSLAEIRGY
ncbi:radical SAM/SPASM domain-containing protein ['Paenibacillus yunnanensis' Narsing Rao et al. 2020]|uniref:radical SAM/SPASM domain-containing protein n=1 Tax=Paenibacillus tengchongensis TaxID=2608684 RepID=UPI00124F124C|nr:radical SAM protein [Paenibacillus tengchongensis]